MRCSSPASSASSASSPLRAFWGAGVEVVEVAVEVRFDTGPVAGGDVGVGEP